VELHPHVGEAVMATLAIACALDEGLDIVGDRRSGPLHECLTKKQPKDVYDTWLKPATADIPDPQKPHARELFEFVISVACDPSKLDAETLAKMGDNRKPIQRLVEELGKRAARMVAMDSGEQREEQFLDETNDILAAWHNDRTNMENYWREFFGFGLLSEAGDFLKKLIEDSAKATPNVGAGGAAALFGLSLHAAILTTVVAGVGIGLFTHAAKTDVDLIKRDRESPYRYLTLMEQAGVVIRTDVRAR